jgi:putative ABC transport system permease protein
MTDAFRLDLLYTLRSIRRAPAFSVTVALILGLGIGMTSAMFTVFESVVLRPLPVRDQDRIVELSGVAQGAATEFPVLPIQLRRFRAQARTLQGVAGIAHWRVFSDALSDGDRPLILREAVVTDNFFQVLGARPAVGRLFQPGDAGEWGSSAPNGVAVVLSFGTWREVFGGDSAVVGRHLHEPKMNWSLTIVGVAPPGLDYPRGVEYWVASNYGGLDVVGRLAPGATPAAARSEYHAFLDHDPDLVKSLGTRTIGAQVHTLEQTVTGDARPALLILSGAVVLLMLLACVNVGNLLLLRAAGRGRELAIRRAIGATTADIVRHLLTESVLLAVAGGVLGVLFAGLLLDGLIRLAPTGVPKLDLITLGGWPLLIGAGVTASTVIVFGVVPSLGALRFDLSSPLRLDGRSGTESRNLRRTRHALVASQIALALVVLAGAGLLLRSLERLTDLSTGYSTDHLALLSVSFSWRQMDADCKPNAAALTYADSVRWRQCDDLLNFNAHDRLMAQLRTAPEIASVSPTTAPPFLGSNVWMGKIVAERQSESDGKANPWFGLDFVGPEFFRTLSVPILKGRAFTNADREGAPRVAVITEGVARRLWPNDDVLGKRFHNPGEDEPDSLITIVGVTADLHFRQYREATPTIFRPYRQTYAQGYFVIATHGSPSASFVAIRRAVRDAGAGAQFASVQSMDNLIAPQLAAPRFEALLLSIFACAAVVLAAIGLYGITASAVSQQTRELGVRLALGATPGSLRRMVLSQALRVTGAGAAVGLIGALVGSRLLTTMLFEVSPFDPLTLMAVSLLLVGVALLAAYLPARRATRIDPARALRAE